MEHKKKDGGGGKEEVEVIESATLLEQRSPED